jgi:ferredoxin/flavodoxin---NADP+ reductase
MPVPHVITQNCCNDASCVPVCPVDCIHPKPDDPDYTAAEMLYIDPDVCIDCGACLEVCPVDAISRDFELSSDMAVFQKINADYFAVTGRKANMDPATWLLAPKTHNPGPGTPTLKVAIVGAGPAGLYTAEALIEQTDVPVRVDVFERLCTPGGLVRFGVAPDHQKTKRVQESFAKTMARDEVRMFFDVEVGRDLTHEDLQRRYDAVVYAVGASEGRRLGIRGEGLRNSLSASEFVAWYNGHPDFADQEVDLSGERAVVLGNGNVALDVARILTADVDYLARTDIADHALARLRRSHIKEVVIVGRRGPEDAAFSAAELHGLTLLEGVDVTVESPIPSSVVTHPESVSHGFSRSTRLAMLRELRSVAPSADRRIVFKFFASPQEILGTNQVEGIRLVRNELLVEGESSVVVATNDAETLACGLVLRAVGYRGTRVPHVPFDDARGIVPNERGRVLGTVQGAPVPGVYTTGWIKRGPSGVIGTNKRCAEETVARILEDFRENHLGTDGELTGVEDLVPKAFGWPGAQAIERHESDAGRTLGRPRVKLVKRHELLAIGRAAVRT